MTCSHLVERHAEEEGGEEKSRIAYVQVSPEAPLEGGLAVLLHPVRELRLRGPCVLVFLLPCPRRHLDFDFNDYFNTQQRNEL